MLRFCPNYACLDRATYFLLHYYSFHSLLGRQQDLPSVKPQAPPRATSNCSTLVLQPNQVSSLAPPTRPFQELSAILLLICLNHHSGAPERSRPVLRPRYTTDAVARHPPAQRVRQVCSLHGIIAHSRATHSSSMDPCTLNMQ